MTSRIAPRTVVEAVLPFSGAAALGDVYDIANQAGLEDQPVRLAIRRLVAAGDVTQTGRGRSGTLELTGRGRARLQRDRESLALAYAHDAGKCPWDGSWRLIAVSVPERDRKVRDSLRRELADLGGVAVSTGLYLSPHDLVQALEAGAGAYLTTATTQDLCVRGMRSPVEIAEAFWPAAAVARTYTAVDEELPGPGPHTGTEDVVVRLHLAEAFERAMRADPLIPPQLRQGAWRPAEIRARWAEEWHSHCTGSAMLVHRGWDLPTPARREGLE